MILIEASHDREKAANIISHVLTYVEDRILELRQRGWSMRMIQDESEHTKSTFDHFFGDIRW